MKKIIALACALVMLVSMFTISANAATDGCTVTLDFAGYTHNDAGTVTYALVDVYVTIPDTLVPYEIGENDDGDEIFSGCMIQSVGIDIPTPAGFTYNTSRSSAASYVQLQNNKAAGKVTIYAANTAGYDTYYAGSVDKIATIAYKIEIEEATELTITDAVIGLVDVEEDGTVVPREYKFADFVCTGETVAPEVVEPEYKDVDYTNAVAANTANIKAEGVEYENVAVFKASFDLADLAAKNAKEYGIALNNAKKAFAFGGAGTVDYVLAFYGVTADDAANIAVDTYYTVSEEVK